MILEIAGGIVLAAVVLAMIDLVAAIALSLALIITIYFGLSWFLSNPAALLFIATVFALAVSILAIEKLYPQIINKHGEIIFLVISFLLIFLIPLVKHFGH